MKGRREKHNSRKAGQISRGTPEETGCVWTALIRGQRAGEEKARRLTKEGEREERGHTEERERDLGNVQQTPWEEESVFLSGIKKGMKPCYWPICSSQYECEYRISLSVLLSFPPLSAASHSACRQSWLLGLLNCPHFSGFVRSREKMRTDNVDLCPLSGLANQVAHTHKHVSIPFWTVVFLVFLFQMSCFCSPCLLSSASVYSLF